MTEATQILATQSEEKIIWEEKKRLKSNEKKGEDRYEFKGFMLKEPEPAKEDLGFTTYKLGTKGTLKRTEIYEDR